MHVFGNYYCLLHVHVFGNYCCLLHLHVHVFGNYWLGGFEDRDPKPIRERDTAVLYSTISGHGTLYEILYGKVNGIPYGTLYNTLLY